MTTNKRNWSADDIQEAIEQVISCERGLEVTEVEPFEEYFTVKFNNDIGLSTVNEIARKVGSKYITIGAEDDYPTLFFSPGMSNDEYWDTADEDDYDYQEQEEDTTPRIPDNMRHTDRFPDAEDIVIPCTEQRVSNTEMCEQILKWMRETGRMPIVYLRLEDGVHVEVSEVYDRRIKAVIADGKAIGADARRYTFDKDSKPWPIGSDICVRATCDETGRSDMYGLSFFV